VEVFLDNVSAATTKSVRKALAEGANSIARFAQPMGDHPLMVTANTSALHVRTYTDRAKDEPTLIEVPPGVPIFLNDAWQHW
jgi:hypothetical protein